MREILERLELGKNRTQKSKSFGSSGRGVKYQVEGFKKVKQSLAKKVLETWEEKQSLFPCKVQECCLQISPSAQGLEALYIL